MKYWKPLLIAGAAALLATAAEAQIRRPPPQTQVHRAVPRQTMPRVANPNDWRRFDSGIRRNDRNFSFAYYSGSPFGINGMIPYYMTGGGMVPGYFYGDIFYSLCAGPRPLTRWEIVNQQWYNISRFGPTIGDLRTMRYNMAMGNPYGYPPSPEVVENPVNEDLSSENEELREWKRQHELEDAERRGYERGRAEACCETQAPTQPVQPAEPAQTDRIRLPVEYSGGVAKVQYAGVAKDFYNFGLFEGLRKVTDGDTNLVAFIEGPYRLVVRDGNDGMSNLFYVDMSGYESCMNVDDLIDKLTAKIPDGINIDQAKVYSARAFVDITKSSYSACTAK